MGRATEDQGLRMELSQSKSTRTVVKDTRAFARDLGQDMPMKIQPKDAPATCPTAPAPGRVRNVLRTILLALAVGLSSVPLALPSSVAVGALVATTLLPHQAEARRSSFSGGYSRPGRSFSSFSRTPSFSSHSSSGGYTRPGSSDATFDGSRRSGSASDRTASRSQSRNAFDKFFSPAPRRPDVSASQSRQASVRTPSFGGRSSGRLSSNSYHRNSAYGYYRNHGYTPPSYAYGGPSHFGAFDAMLLWFMLDTLSNRSHANFFRDNRNDPDYLAWRREADARATDDPALATKLKSLDSQLAAGPGDPSKAGQLPPGIPASAGLAEPPRHRGWFGTLIPLLILGGFAYMAWRMTRKADNRAKPATPRAVGGNGSILGSAAAILRNKLSGASYRPDLFRVGMPLGLDPTPFVLGGTAIKAVPPQAKGASGSAVVEAVGTLTDDAGTYHRLYLDDRSSFFQIVTDSAGHPSESRCFSRIDEVQPASHDEWGFWLDDDEGMIGWPVFETTDGQRYDRLWSPGTTRIAPRRMTETIKRVNGGDTRELRMMLYVRPTGLATPAPEHEYLLVTAVAGKGESWVEIHAGLDINPSALTLS